MEFLQNHQLNIMQSFIGVCAAMVIMLPFTKVIKKRRRNILLAIDLSAFFLLLCDRLAHAASGDVTRLGYFAVRLTNFATFFFTAEIIFVFCFYVYDLLRVEGEMKTVPTRLKVAGALAIAAMVLSVVAHFTGLYYMFDDQNVYHRSSSFAISYILPVTIILILMTVIHQYRKLFGKWIYISLVLFIAAPFAASFLQMVIFGLSIINVSFVVVAFFLYIFAYLQVNEEIERAHKDEIEFLEDEKKSIHRLFDKTVKSFVNALDGRYVHTRGHSQRVADYSRKIAEFDGKSESECEEIYYAALLHDVGRIWMPDDVVKNYGKLSDEDAEKVRRMPVIGSQILSDIDDMPNIDVGAHYHCERYDGKGYPDGLAGEDIPDAARIIAAADAYDLMATEGDLTPPMPVQLIREQLVQRSGHQLDPKYAKIILQILDSKETDMDASISNVAAVYENEFYCNEYKDHVTAGTQITDELTRIRLTFTPEKNKEEDFSAPSLILFDSYDGRVHDLPKEIEAFRYTEFGEVWLDGHIVCTGARNMEVTKNPSSDIDLSGERSYEIAAYRKNDHLRITIASEETRLTEVIVALPDSSLFAYLSLTGEHCRMSSVTIEKLEVGSELEEIPRIAEPISYIDRLESDLPNVQINGKRTAATKGVLVNNALRIDFHTMSLPSADLIWHCPYIVLYSSDDGTVGGEGYVEYALIRLNGETKETDEVAQNVITVDKDDDFESWEKWKERNHIGYDCRVEFERLSNKITVITSNCGISIENVTTILKGTKKVYAAITGDQCAITDIRIR